MIKIEYNNPNKPINLPNYNHELTEVDFNRRTVSVTFTIPKWLRRKIND